MPNDSTAAAKTKNPVPEKLKHGVLSILSNLID